MGTAHWSLRSSRRRLLAFAMGLQNATMTRFSGASLNTVFLTGNLQKMMQGFLGRFTGDRPKHGPSGVRRIRDDRLVYGLAYLGGVVAGAFAHHWQLTYPLLPVVAASAPGVDPSAGISKQAEG